MLERLRKWWNKRAGEKDLIKPVPAIWSATYREPFSPEHYERRRAAKHRRLMRTRAHGQG